MSGAGSNRIDGFDEIFYLDDVEHGQMSFLGSCPLGRDIVVEQTRETRISWYVQRGAEHGCERATDFGRFQSGEAWRDEPIVARYELTLSPAHFRQLVEQLKALSWKIEWARSKMRLLNRMQARDYLAPQSTVGNGKITE